MDSSSKQKGTMEAISEEEDERVMDLEAEVEELREQVRSGPCLDCTQAMHGTCHACLSI